MTRRSAAGAAPVGLAAVIGVAAVVGVAACSAGPAPRPPPPPGVQAPHVVPYAIEETWVDADRRFVIGTPPCRDDDQASATVVLDRDGGAAVAYCAPGCLPGCVPLDPPVVPARAADYAPEGLTWTVELARGHDDALAPAEVERAAEPAVRIRWAPASTVAGARGDAPVHRVVFAYRRADGAIARFAVSPVETAGFATTLVTVLPLSRGAVAWIISGADREDDDRQAVAWLGL